ncbi:MAG: CBM21 domain-containing protein [Verrucomicrobia bacterium]|nr:CBM21 domain-containing protein [Verrucomicrobiota bacterium]
MKRAIAITLIAAAVITTAASSFAADLELIGEGIWISDSTPPILMWEEDISLWVDIKVPNWSYNKVVGIVWTADKWETVNYSYASYEYTRWDGYEQWGVDVVPAGILGNSYIGPGTWNGKSLMGPGPQTAEIEFAIFYTLPDGYTIWDNNGGMNYMHLVASRS